MKYIVAFSLILAVAFAGDETTMSSVEPSEDEVLFSPARSAVISSLEDDSLIVDGEEMQLKTALYKENSFQRWKVDYLGASRNTIRNEGNSRYLDLEKGKNAVSGDAIVARDQTPGRESQIWYFKSDHTIRNAAVHDLAMDIQGAVYKPNTPIIAYTHHGKANQRFKVTYQ